MSPCRALGFLFSLFVANSFPAGTAYAAPLTAAAITGVYGQITVRREAALQAEADNPFPSPICGAPRAGDACLLGKLNHGLALLARGRDAQEIASANDEIAAAVSQLPSAPGFNMEDGKADASEETAQPFHFMRAGILYRIVRLFGAAGTRAPGRLTSTNERAIYSVFWDWANGDCRMSDTNPAHLWTPWGSENHDAQHDGTCWEAADLFRRTPEYSDRSYEDQSYASGQFSAWTAYLERYLKERARWGLVEYFSPTYTRYTLDNIYIYADFSDAALQNLAHEFLDLWWVGWAQEQVDGVFGGTETRVYAKEIPNGNVLAGLAWMYFGKGGNVGDARAPGIFPATLSGYVPAPVIVDIALDTTGRGSFSVDARAPGLAASVGCRTLGGARGTPQCALDPSAQVIRRTAYITPEFVMGSPIVAKLTAKEWFAGSAQDREAGLVMAGGDPRARIAAFPLAIAGGGKHYNGIWAVQSKATQIVVAAPAPFSKNVSAMRVWFGPSLVKSENDGWVFARGAAYAAVRPAVGGYHWDSQDPGWLVPNDPTTPVVIQAATTDDYPNFAAFQVAVQNAKLTTSGDSVEFAGLDGAGRVALSNGVGRVNGAPVEAAFGASLRSPFVNQALGSDHVLIAKGARKLTLDF